MRKSVLWLLAAAIVFAATGAAASSDDVKLSPVATANTKAAGYAPASRLSTELQQVVAAQGSTKLENPQGIFTNYGYENDMPSADDPEPSWTLIRIAMESRARLAIVPAQDVLGLGSEARMNMPGRADGNWSWRLRRGQLTAEHARSLRELTRAGRR